MLLGQLLHWRRVRASERQRRSVPQRQPMHERELLERPVLLIHANRLWRFLRFPVKQQLELRELRAFLCDGLDVFGWNLLSAGWSFLLDGQSVLERRLWHVLRGFRR